jgi:tetratricopeptide (TPR) repeat protein
MLSAMVLAALIFTGFLAFKLSDDEELFRHGKQLYREGKTAWAINTFETLITHNPKHYEAYLYLGRAYLEEHNLPKAEQAFRQASLIRESTEVGAELTTAVVTANLAMIRGRYRDAEVALLPLTQHPEYQQNPEFRAVITKLYTTWGDELSQQAIWQRAILQYEQALQYVREVKDQKALEMRVLLCYQALIKQAQKAKDTPNLIKYYTQRLKYQHTLSDVLTLADLEKQQHHWPQALDWYRRAYQEDTALGYQPLQQALRQYRTTLPFQNQFLVAQITAELEILEQAFLRSQPVASQVTHMLPVAFQGLEVKNLVLVRPTAGMLHLLHTQKPHEVAPPLEQLRQDNPYGLEIYFVTPPKYPFQTLRFRLKIQPFTYNTTSTQNTKVHHRVPLASASIYELPASALKLTFFHPDTVAYNTTPHARSHHTARPSQYHWISYWPLAKQAPHWLQSTASLAPQPLTEMPRGTVPWWKILQSETQKAWHGIQNVALQLPFQKSPASKTVLEVELQAHVFSQHPDDWIPLRRESFVLGASLGNLEGQPGAI